MRTSKGVSLKKLSQLTDKKQYNKLVNQMCNFTNESLLFYEKERFFLTEEGMILCDKITSDLFLM